MFLFSVSSNLDDFKKLKNYYLLWIPPIFSQDNNYPQKTRNRDTGQEGEEELIGLHVAKYNCNVPNS